MSLTGIYSCNDGCTYYVRSLHSTVCWLGLSTDGGQSLTTVAWGTVAWDGCRVRLQWAELQLSGQGRHGTLTLLTHDPETLTKSGENGPFAGTEWRRISHAPHAGYRPDCKPVGRPPAVRLRRHQHSVTGVWCCDSSGTYCVREVTGAADGTATSGPVFWLGLSHDNGLDWAHVGLGALDAARHTLALQWMDVPLCQRLGHGAVRFAVDQERGLMQRPPEPGPFPGTRLGSVLEGAAVAQAVLVDPKPLRHVGLRDAMARVGITLTLCSDAAEPAKRVREDVAEGAGGAGSGPGPQVSCVFVSLATTKGYAGPEALPALQAAFPSANSVAYGTGVDRATWHECQERGASVLLADRLPDRALQTFVLDVLRAKPCVRGRAAPFVLGISGGVRSGKSSLAKNLQMTLPDTVVFSQDDYADEAVIADCLGGLRHHPGAFNTMALLKDVCDCLNGPKAWGLIVVEGFLVFQDAALSRLMDGRVWIDVPASGVYDRLRPLNTKEEDERVLQDVLRVYERYKASFAAQMAEMHCIDAACGQGQALESCMRYVAEMREKLQAAHARAEAALA